METKPRTWQQCFDEQNCCGQPWDCCKEFCSFREKLAPTTARHGDWHWLREQLDNEMYIGQSNNQH